jgi:hypothetical protein
VSVKKWLKFEEESAVGGWRVGRLADSAGSEADVAWDGLTDKGRAWQQW